MQYFNYFKFSKLRKINIQNINRVKHLLYKEIIFLVNRSKNSIPIFVFGKHRSGTSMLMRVLERRRDVRVYNEAKNNKIYWDYKIRNFEIIEEANKKSGAPFTAYKPIADSYMIDKFVDRFPNCKAIWIYRNYKDTTNSTYLKWPDTYQFIRNRGNSSRSDVFFSKETSKIIDDIYTPELTDFDCVCLIWWVKNRIVIEKKLYNIRNILLVDYDKLVQNRTKEFDLIFNFLYMKFTEKDIFEVHNQSVRKTTFRGINKNVEFLCEELTLQLEEALNNNRKLHDFPS